jgi:cell division protein FtsX
MDTKVLQTIGTILLVGILFVAVLVYSNTSGLAPVLNEVKAGVNKLIGWFIPASYRVEITPANISGVSVSGNTIKLSNVTASGEIATIEVSGNYDGNIKIAVAPDVTGGTVSVAVKSKSNATVTIAAAGEIIVSIYPAGEFDVVLSISLSGSGASGTIIVNTARY